VVVPVRGRQVRRLAMKNPRSRRQLMTQTPETATMAMMMMQTPVPAAASVSSQQQHSMLSYQQASASTSSPTAWHQSDQSPTAASPTIHRSDNTVNFLLLSLQSCIIHKMSLKVINVNIVCISVLYISNLSLFVIHQYGSII